jgi:hypothetical protein
MEEKRKKEAAKDRGKQPLSPLAYAIISLVAFVIGIGLLLFFVYKADDLVAQGIDEKVFYVLLLPLGLSAAAFLFGAMRSYARYMGKVFSGMLELGGPVVLFIMVAAGGFVLVPDTDPFDFTIILRDSNRKTVLKDQGKIIITFGNRIEEGEIDKNGSVYFKGIPAKFRNKEVPIEIDASGWQFANDRTTCKLKNNNATIIIERHKCLATVSGSVKDSEGNFIGGAIVVVKGIDDKTDENGRFLIQIPTEKQEEWQPIIAKKQGYEAVNSSVDPCSPKEIVIILTKK